MTPNDALFGALQTLIADAVRPIVREEIASSVRAKEDTEADQPRPAAWWAKQLGCSAESLVQRARRGTLECVRVGSRYHFTRAQIEGSKRWQRRAAGG